MTLCLADSSECKLLGFVKFKAKFVSSFKVMRNSSHPHSAEVPVAHFSLYVHKCSLKPHSFHFLFTSKYVCLKRHNQVKNQPKANIIFSFLEMFITCEHGHRLELWKSFKYWDAVAT